jgi:hypothetical protein
MDKGPKRHEVCTKPRGAVVGILVAMGLSQWRRLQNFDEMVRDFEANTEKSDTHFGFQNRNRRI